jgi:hypothetical protein
VAQPAAPEVERAGAAQHQGQQAGLQCLRHLVDGKHPAQPGKRVDLVEPGLHRLPGEVPASRQQAAGQRHTQHDGEQRPQHGQQAQVQVAEALEHLRRVAHHRGVEAQAFGQHAGEPVVEQRCRGGQYRHHAAQGTEVPEVTRTRDLAVLARLLDLARCGG